MAIPGEPAAMTRSEKIIWIFFAATSCQLALQRPSFLLVAGERSNLFSGLLCFLTLIVAVVLGQAGRHQAQVAGILDFRRPWR